MFSPALRMISRKRPGNIVAIACAMLMAVAAVDWASGPDFAMGLLYLMPVALVTLALGRQLGLLMSLLTVLLWASAELLGAAAYSRPWIALPNAATRLAYFSLMVYLLSIWRDLGERLEAQVQQRTQQLRTEVAERKLAEEAVHRLTLQIADAEDAQRRRIAQDIHDTVGQTLTLVKFRLQGAHAPAGNGDPPPDPQVTEALTLLDAAIGQTRTLTFELYPPMLDDLGLTAALRWLARELSRQTQTEIIISEEGEPRTLPRTIASYLFRSIKELIANALKHGQSSEIVVTLYWRPSSIRAAVDDNGCGFDAEQTAAQPSGGIGLASIRERVSTLGGSFSVESQRDAGARVIIDVPTSGK